MITAKKLKDDYTINLDYIIGFFDGEGCVSASKIKKLKGFMLRPEINIRNTNKNILLQIEKYLKNRGITGKVYLHSKISISKNRKRGYHYRIVKLEDILKFTFLLKDKSQIKHKQLNLLHDFLLCRMEKKKRRIPLTYTKKDIEIFEKIQLLNRRGINAKLIKEEFEDELNDLQNKCVHNNMSEWMEHSWAPSHFSGYQVKQCNICWKIIEYRTNCIACKIKFTTKEQPKTYQNNCLCDKCLKKGKYYCVEHKKFYNDPHGCPECVKYFE